MYNFLARVEYHGYIITLPLLCEMGGMDLIQYLGLVTEKRADLNSFIKKDITSYYMNYSVMRGEART